PPFPHFPDTTLFRSRGPDRGGDVMSAAEARAFAYAFAASPCGGLHVEVAGVRTMLRPCGGLWLERERALIVSDLHLEKGSSYARRGQLLPPYDTAETLARLERELAALD